MYVSPDVMDLLLQWNQLGIQSATTYEEIESLKATALRIEGAQQAVATAISIAYDRQKRESQQ